jgi:hypothetical protein
LWFLFEGFFFETLHISVKPIKLVKQMFPMEM